MVPGLVSVIMPSFNTGRFIAESIESVLAQTYTNWELLIVDDASTDNTDEVVQSVILSVAQAKSKDLAERIHYFKNDRNRGAAYSRNLALREANGEWIAFLDSDDLWLPEKLEKQLKFMIDNDYKFSGTGRIEIDENSNPLETYTRSPHHVGNYAIWLKVIKKCDFYAFDDILSMYRVRTKSISHDSLKKLVKSHYDLFRIGEEMSLFSSMFFTCLNMFFGMWKKIRYVGKTV